jgi:hypothetical protein
LPPLPQLRQLAGKPAGRRSGYGSSQTVFRNPGQGARSLPLRLLSSSCDHCRRRTLLQRLSPRTCPVHCGRPGCGAVCVLTASANRPAFINCTITPVWAPGKDQRQNCAMCVPSATPVRRGLVLVVALSSNETASRFQVSDSFVAFCVTVSDAFIPSLVMSAIAWSTASAVSSTSWSSSNSECPTSEPASLSLSLVS